MFNKKIVAIIIGWVLIIGAANAIYSETEQKINNPISLDLSNYLSEESPNPTPIQQTGGSGGFGDGGRIIKPTPTPTVIQPEVVITSTPTPIITSEQTQIVTITPEEPKSWFNTNIVIFILILLVIVYLFLRKK